MAVFIYFTNIFDNLKEIIYLMFDFFSGSRPFQITQKDVSLFELGALRGDGVSIEFGHVKVMQKVINQEN